MRHYNYEHRLIKELRSPGSLILLRTYAFLTLACFARRSSLEKHRRLGGTTYEGLRRIRPDATCIMLQKSILRKSYYFRTYAKLNITPICQCSVRLDAD